MARLLVVSGVAAALFWFAADIDLWVSRLFYDGEDFPLMRADALEMVRHLIWAASTVVALGALALWLAWLRLGRSAEVPARVWGWIAAVYLLGPGLLVNGLLKEKWGRARPAYVFDGEARFTPAFVLTDQCDRNCSFVSGEAAAAAALAIVLGALIWPHLGLSGRRCAAAALAALAGAAGMMRVLTGRHFVSDVIFAWLLVALVTLWLWRVMRMSEAIQALSVRALRTDLRALAGRASRFWRRLVP